MDKFVYKIGEKKEKKNQEFLFKWEGKSIII